MAPSPDPLPTAPASGEPLAAPRHSHAGFSWAKFNQGVLPTLLAGVMAGMMLFTLNESSDRMTRIEDRIDRLEANVDARFTKLGEHQQQIAVMLATFVGEFAAFQQDVDNRFDAVNARFDAVDTRFDAVDARFAAIETRLTSLEENQQQIALTLSRLVTLLEGRDEAPATPSG